jgi:hypothetical protein
VISHCNWKSRLQALRIATALLAMLSVSMVRPAHAAEAYSEDAVKAAFLYRFVGYVDWPARALAGPQFTIAVLGAEGVAAKLEMLLPNRTLKNLPTQVRQIKNVQELGNAQILYIGPRSTRDLQTLIAAVADRPVLIVTDDERGLDVGSTVNFLLLDRRVRFEVSLAAAQRSGLRISSELLSVATRVQGVRLRSDASCVPGTSRHDPDLCPVWVADAQN